MAQRDVRGSERRYDRDPGRLEIESPKDRDRREVNEACCAQGVDLEVVNCKER